MRETPEDAVRELLLLHDDARGGRHRRRRHGHVLLLRLEKRHTQTRNGRGVATRVDAFFSSRFERARVGGGRRQRHVYFFASINFFSRDAGVART